MTGEAFNITGVLTEMNKASPNVGAVQQLINGATLGQLNHLVKSITENPDYREALGHLKRFGPMRDSILRETNAALLRQRQETIQQNLQHLAERSQQRIEEEYAVLYAQFPELKANAPGTSPIDQPINTAFTILSKLPVVGMFFAQAQPQQGKNLLYDMLSNSTIPFVGAWARNQLVRSLIQQNLPGRTFDYGSIRPDAIAKFASENGDWKAALLQRLGKIATTAAPAAVITWTNVLDPDSFERSAKEQTQTAYKKEVAKNYNGAVAVEFGADAGAARGPNGWVVTVPEGSVDPAGKPKPDTDAAVLAEALKLPCDALAKIVIAKDAPLTFRSDGAGKITVELPADKAKEPGINDIAKALKKEEYKYVRVARFDRRLGTDDKPAVEIRKGDGEYDMLVWNRAAQRELGALATLPDTDQKLGKWQLLNGSWDPVTSA